MNREEKQQALSQIFPIPSDLPVFTESRLGFKNENGIPVTDPSRRIIYNKNNNKVVNVVKSTFKYEQFSKSFEIMNDILIDADLDISGMKREYEVSIDDAKIKIIYTLPEYKIDLGNGDVTEFQLFHYNSMDGVWKWSLMWGMVRMICLNSQVSYSANGLYLAKHTPSLSPDHAKEKITAGINQFKADGENWKRWRSNKVTDKQAFRMFALAASSETAIQKSKQAPSMWMNDARINISEILEETEVLKNKNLQYLWNQWQQESRILGKTEWAIFNTLTHWSTHSAISLEKRKTKGSMVTKLKKEKTVRKIIRENFKDLTRRVA